MKRDMDLVRKLLLAIEGSKSTSIQWQTFPVDGYSQEEVRHHLILLKDAGLLLGPPLVIPSPKNNSFFVDNILDSSAFGLSWAGHEFLDEARDDTRWNQAKEIARDKSGSLAFEAVKAVLGEMSKQAVKAAMNVMMPGSAT